MKFEQSKSYRLKPENFHKYTNSVDQDKILANIIKDKPFVVEEMNYENDTVTAIKVNGVTHYPRPGFYWLNQDEAFNFLENLDYPTYRICLVSNGIVFENDKFRKDLSELEAKELLDIINKVTEDQYVIVKNEI